MDPKVQNETNIELSKSFKKSTYFLLDAKETLNITITPAFLKIVNEILTVYSSKTLSIMTNTKSINLINDIGPKTTVELYENKGNEDLESIVLIHSKTYENEDSCPNSPSRMIYMIPEFSEEANEDRDR